MGESFWADGLRFFCTQCSRCCRHDAGYVFLSRLDLSRLIAFVGECEADFIDRYCIWVPFGQGAHLSLREQANHDCVFWRDGGCQVYDGRPFQCRSYPFWRNTLERREYWESEANECPGIGIGRRVSAFEIEKMLQERERNLPLYRGPGYAG